MTMEELIAVVALLLGINVFSRIRDRRNPRRRLHPGLGRPVKRFKSKVRGFHVRPKEVIVAGVIGDRNDHILLRGVDHANWVRVWPNPGYRIAGWHWCWGTHRRRIKWEG